MPCDQIRDQKKQILTHLHTQCKPSPCNTSLDKKGKNPTGTLFFCNILSFFARSHAAQRHDALHPTSVTRVLHILLSCPPSSHCKLCRLQGSSLSASILTEYLHRVCLRKLCCTIGWLAIDRQSPDATRALTHMQTHTSYVANNNDVSSR